MQWVRPFNVSSDLVGIFIPNTNILPIYTIYISNPKVVVASYTSCLKIQTLSFSL